MTFPDWLRDQMEHHHLNQPGLAETLGVNQSTVSNWLRGKTLPDSDKLVALSKLFRYDHLSLLEIVGVINGKGPEMPSVEEQQIVDRLKMLRQEPEYRAVVQVVVSLIDLVLAAKDGAGDPDEKTESQKRHDLTGVSQTLGPVSERHRRAPGD